MAKKQPLGEYHRKRDFGQTPEPSGPAKHKAGPRGKTGGKAAPPAPREDHVPAPHTHPQRIFVVQMHDASHLHYDFRLEVEGVLKSWAVPKGPSMSPSQKRLAVLTEDHPLEYAAFEGVIPEGNYGAGSVIVWDGGVYRNLRHDAQGNEVPMEQACEQGHVTVFLEGRKLRGAFALTRTRIDGGRQNWILVKMRDEFADDQNEPVQDRPESILSGKTVGEIAREHAPEPMEHFS